MSGPGHGGGRTGRGAPERWKCGLCRCGQNLTHWTWCKHCRKERTEQAPWRGANRWTRSASRPRGASTPSDKVSAADLQKLVDVATQLRDTATATTYSAELAKANVVRPVHQRTAHAQRKATTLEN